MFAGIPIASDDMSGEPHAGGSTKPPRSFSAAAWVAVLASVLFGTVGAAWTDFTVGFNCADHFSCGSLSCPPCARSVHWVLAGLIGQWTLVPILLALIVLGRRHHRFQRPITLALATFVLVSATWYLVATAQAIWWLPCLRLWPGSFVPKPTCWATDFGEPAISWMAVSTLVRAGSHLVVALVTHLVTRRPGASAARNPNRISSSGRCRPDRFHLDQRPGPVPCGSPCTTVNCN